MTVKKSQKAFTLIEILLVIGIFSILAILTLPLSLDFYKKYQLDIYTQEIVQALRRAQLKSMSVEQDSRFGIYLAEGNYVLFRGNSYAVRELQYDEIFDIPYNISLSGLSEIVFSKLSGLPSVSGDIILTNGNEERIININSIGRISYKIKLVSPPPPPPLNCWGTGGSCDSLCQYLNYGTLTSYYVNPGCATSCLATGSIYVGPSGFCSTDGTGNCYKMESPAVQYTSSSQGTSCRGACSGVCRPCTLLRTQSTCINQRGCSWVSGRCLGTCLSCSDSYFNNRVLCENQRICSWADTSWYWNLSNSQNGYNSYVTCQWY
ncbi:MAG: type II secretion system protein [Candidatus Nealsonbacteria bacterium]|nr:type II secretion system protein [Candidatus Nealsonbacteria bacterium]